MDQAKKFRSAFYLLTSLFFLWGFVTVLVDSLIPRIKELFTLNYFQAGLVQFAFFMAYFLLSIPAGLLLSRIGYKKGIVLGLVTMAFGCLLFFAAADQRVFAIFLSAYFVLAGGMTILQVAANPFVTILGDAKSASSRLNLAQGFNSFGTTIAPIIGASFLLSDTVKTTAEIDLLSDADRKLYYIQEASTVQMPFMVIAGFILCLALIFLLVKLPNIIQSNVNSGYLSVLKDKKLVGGAFAIFVYVGAEVAIGSYLVNYFISMNMQQIIIESNGLQQLAKWVLWKDDLGQVDSKGIVASFVFLYWGGAMIGRFVGAVLTKKFDPAIVLRTFALLAVSMILISMATQGTVSMFAILSVGLFNSIMFPTIFSISIEDLGDSKPQGSGILCTMIVGGAIIPPAYGLLTDSYGFKLAMILLILCYGYIMFFGQRSARA